MNQTIVPSATVFTDLADKVVIVTGGGRGLGRSIADGFAMQGATVILVGRSLTQLNTAVSEIVEAGGKAAAFAADIADEDSVSSLSQSVHEMYGRIDVLVNNAGINPWYKSAEKTTLQEWRQILDINLTGVFLTCKYVGQLMLDAGQGSIINITSVAGRVGLAKTTAYCAAKGGVEMLTRQLALEWAPRGIRVNAVAPGYFATELTEGLRAHPVLGRQVLDRTPMGRFGEPQEIVGASLFLASSAAAYVTGHSLAVDGGWTAS